MGGGGTEGEKGSDDPLPVAEDRGVFDPSALVSTEFDNPPVISPSVCHDISTLSFTARTTPTESVPDMPSSLSSRAKLPLPTDWAIDDAISALSISKGVATLVETRKAVPTWCIALREILLLRMGTSLYSRMVTSFALTRFPDTSATAFLYASCWALEKVAAVTPAMSRVNVAVFGGVGGGKGDGVGDDVTLSAGVG